MCLASVLSDSATPWTVAFQAPLSMGTQACPPCPPGDLPNPGIEPRSPTLKVDYLPSESLGKPSNWNKLK